MKNKLLAILIATLVLGGSAVAIFAVMQPSAEDILVQAIETSEAITDGHAIIELNATLPDEEISATAEIWGKLNVGPNGEPAVRIELLSASKEEAGGTVFVADGTQFWLWNPTANTVIVGTAADVAAMMEERMAEFDGMGEFDHEFDKESADEMEHPETPEDAVAKLLEYFTVEKAGSANIDGTAVSQLRLIPIAEQMPDEFRLTGGLLDIWLRSADSAPVAIEFSGNAAVAGKATATSLEINQGVDDSLFTFTIPAGAELINVKDIEMPDKAEMELADPEELGLLVPTQLPDGATLLDTMSMAGTAVQQYSLPDGNKFTVAQGTPNAAYTPDDVGETVTVRGIEAILFADGEDSRTLLTWTENETQFWVGGDLTPEQAVAIADSLE